MFRNLLISILAIVLLSACTVAQGAPLVPNPEDPVAGTPDEGYPVPNEEPVSFEPREEDAELERGLVYIDSTDLLIMESYPVQIMLAVKGAAPTPCHHVRIVVNPPDAENNILVEAYSVVDPEQICIQVLAPFEANINLGSFPTGNYSVLLNGEKVGEFES
ncbi:MAG: hypothetical protein AB1453_02045 [Chloroflexota bacterium]